MRKIILTIIMIASAYCVNAQSFKMVATIPSAALGSPSGTDSVRINGATAGYLYIKPSAAYKCGSFQGNITRVTAAMNGTCRIEGSNDGINYTATAAADTFHVDNGATDSDVKTFSPSTGVLYQYYRIRGVNSATTDTFTLKAFFHGRQ